jgi:hypothetical protein
MQASELHHSRRRTNLYRSARFRLPWTKHLTKSTENSVRKSISRGELPLCSDEKPESRSEEEVRDLSISVRGRFEAVESLTKTLLVVTPRHSIKLSDKVVRVVANTPMASAVCCGQKSFSLHSVVDHLHLSQFFLVQVCSGRHFRLWVVFRHR